jgi:hypothetical protein
LYKSIPRVVYSKTISNRDSLARGEGSNAQINTAYCRIIGNG